MEEGAESPQLVESCGIAKLKEHFSACINTLLHIDTAIGVPFPRLCHDRKDI